ncbi:MAG: glycoside hydrolase family 31 protein [Candidatus Limiplasma sp.]|nr:glycoside hydrolase family 31 protein [Candidatus Limiplasma sp.]MEA5145627.1 glycoside hydrolase family 31 protein [Candidatus Limiplasma sp.]
MTFEFLPGELWWVGRTFDGVHMPLDATATYEVDLRHVKPNAGAAVMLSSHGRYVAGTQPFCVSMAHGSITVQGQEALALQRAGNTLMDAYLAVAQTHFQSGSAPDPLCFSAPQYNSWIEVGFDTTQQKVLDYAQGLIDSGAQPGILIIDDNWMVRYGQWKFDRERFPDPKAMVAALHGMGFAVMLWVIPYTVASGHPYLELKDERLYVMNRDGTPKLTPWWNGTSCLLDMSNPQSVRFLTDQLDALVAEFGIDGFKFDAGDPLMQDGTFAFHHPIAQNEDDTCYSRIGLGYRLAEYRESWNMGGAPLMLRQQDKAHTWDESGLRTLIPNGLALSLMGYHYHCPDMVGGGDLGVVDIHKPLDQELFVRCTQASVLFPIIQFSMAPHRLLDAQHFQACEKALAVRRQLTPYLLERVAMAAHRHQPIFAPLEMYYPHQGLGRLTQAFCVGDRYIVYPTVHKGQTEATFPLPKGTWRDWRGKVFTTQMGECRTYAVTLEDMPYFERQDSP